jgi:hypothetical protein
MSITDTYPRLLDELNALRWQWRAQKIVEGVLLAFTLAAGVLVATIAADNLLKLDVAGRAVLCSFFWASAIFGFLSWVVRRWLEDRRDDFFAALVEAHHPELANRLINALQLGRGNNYGSPRLIEQIVEDAATATAELEMTNCLSWRRPAYAALGAAGVVATIAIYASVPAWSLSDRFGNGLVRVMAPWSATPPFTATRIDAADVKPGDKRVPEGAKVQIEAVASGEVPASARVALRDEGAGWRTAAMQSGAGGAGTFLHTVPEAGRSFDYYVLAGDGRSRQFTIEVVPRPRVARIDLALLLPPYTGAEPRPVPQSDGEIAALAGTIVEYRLTADKPLSEAALVTDAGQIVPLAPAEGKSAEWTARFTLSTAEATVPHAEGPIVAGPARYQVRLRDTDGYENADPLWHSIGVVRDQAPSVAIVAPGRDLQVKPDEKVALRLAAKDDYGLADVRLVYRVNEEQSLHELIQFAPDPDKPGDLGGEYPWDLASSGLKSGDIVQYWATALDANDVTGPGRGESRRYSLLIVQPEEVVAQLQTVLLDYADALEELVRLQRENRAQAASGVAFSTLVTRETLIRTKTQDLAGRMERDASPARTMTEALQELYVGLMADCVRLLEGGRDAANPAQAQALRDQSLPVQDAIIAQLQELLARLQRNEQARTFLRKLSKSDQAAHWAITARLNEMTDDLERLLAEEQELAEKFDKLPKKPVDELSEEQQQVLDDFDEFQERWNKWAKGTVDELSKLPTGFIDDFGLREDVNRIFEEIERVAQRPKTSKLEVALEDLGAGLAREMLEDLELWMPDSPDALQWVLEEPLAKLDVPEMPLPSELEDLMGDLLQEAEEFDQEADDITSAWGDNLNQAGWDVMDGPISSFSAKGKTGNDLPNNMEVSGRSGDGRRGKSSGQMVGDTARALEGRRTPARVNGERYEPGQIKQEGEQDPNGATGGGKKAGAGRRGLQGGTPPDFIRDMDRLSERQAAIRERAEQVAQQLDGAGIKSSRLDRTIELMRTAEDDLRDYRYEDAARRRKVALGELRTALTGDDQGTAVQLSRARELPSELREELLQSADEGYPQGYESLLQSYFRALSEGE